MHGYGYMGWGWIVPLLIIGAFFYWFSNQQSGSGKQEKSPLDILNERFAKGEIDEKEYRKKRDLLGSGGN